MSYVTVVPEAVMSTASELANLGSAITEANAAAAVPTTSVVAAAQDEVSTAIAELFGSYAQQFQALSAKAAAFRHQFVQALTGGAASYVKAEAANVLGLMGGSHTGASGAAALRNAAAATPALFDLGGVGEKVDNFLSVFDPLFDAERRIADAWGLVDRANQIQRIVANGLKLIGQDGARLYTDGREVVAIGGRYPFHFPYSADFIYARKFITDAWGISPQSLFGSEMHVVFRGEGLAQHALQKVGNEFYHIETNVQGQIISRIPTTEAIARETLARMPQLSLLSEIQKDVYNAIDQAEEAFLRQAEQASRQVAEQGLKEAYNIIEEARIAGLLR